MRGRAPQRTGTEPTPEERIASALVEADRMLELGRSLDDVTTALGVSRSTYYRWRHRFDGVSRGGVLRIRDLERENSRLRRIVADSALEIEMLRELSRGTY